MREKYFKLRLQTKLIIGLVLMAMVLTSCLVPAIASLYRGRMEEYYSKIAFDQATIAADYIDGDTIMRYYETGEKDDYYYTVHDYLLRVKQTIGLEYFYVVYLEDEEMVYIWDSGVPGEEGVCDLGDRDAYYGGGDELMHGALAPDAPNTILITNNEEYGYLASAYVAILDSNGKAVALASVDVSMDMINDQIREFVTLGITVTLGVLLVAVLLYYIYIRRSVVRPLGKLHTAASNLVRENIQNVSDFSIDINTGDEIQELAEAFQYMTQELGIYIHDLADMTAEKERIGAELNVATTIQASMLPNQFPAFPEHRNFDIYATMTPAKEVGGDFYDFFLIDDSHLGIVMADVSGKGVPAALFMVRAMTLIKTQAMTGQSAGGVLASVNEELCTNNEGELFVTVWLGILDLSTGEMTFANAGHEQPLVRHEGQYSYLKQKVGFVLGGMEGMRYPDQKLMLEPGDALVQYTDGVTEATDSREQLYGTGRLLESINRRAHQSPDTLLPGLKQDIDEFVGEAPQFDDITMLVLEYKGNARSGDPKQEG